MSLFRVQDDLGRAVRLAPLWRFATPTLRDELAPPQRAILRQRVALPLAISLAIILAVLGIFAAIVTGLAIATGSRIFGLVFHTPVQAAGIGMAITVGGLIRIAWLAHAGRQEREALRVAVCPSCLYSLTSAYATGARATGAQATGQTVTCPECASAWRLDRIGIDPAQPAAPRVLDSQLNPSSPATPGADHATAPEQTTAATGGGPSP